MYLFVACTRGTERHATTIRCYRNTHVYMYIALSLTPLHQQQQPLGFPLARQIELSLFSLGIGNGNGFSTYCALYGHGMESVVRRCCRCCCCCKVMSKMLLLSLLFWKSFAAEIQVRRQHKQETTTTTGAASTFSHKNRKRERSSGAEHFWSLLIAFVILGMGMEKVGGTNFQTLTAYNTFYQA